MNSQPNREVSLFSAALELPAGQRAAYLDQACADDPALRQRVEELLRVHADAITFLENNLPGAEPSAAGAIALSGATLPNSSAEKAGDRIGRYKLLQQIGEGGCGIVYMAEQEEPVRRRVALKVIKLGMDTKQVTARFQAERQALALMDHPNIAQVFDAGSTDNGRPYFVMELVRGIKITDYCDQNNLSTTDRLNLFIQVCHAIQHAHQKGIIHRDIKPSNILVASNDGVPVPKVIDFGIAKATQGRLTDQTVFTAFEQFIGTPAYMSPEQAQLTMLDIDTRTDIYSLGVLLYELLTGKTPFDQKDLIAAGLDEMRRTIREKEPPRPSTRLSTMAESEQTTTAQHRRTDAPKLIHLVRGDLDWIVMKALDKDRARRYETASGLANDVKRHLNCEPVVARPTSKLYEFQKTTRRHKFGFGAAAALITVLAAGVVVSTRLWMMESDAHRRALTAEQSAEVGRRAEATSRQRAQQAERTATEELWHAYVAQARAARFSAQPGRRFDSLAALSKAAAIRFAPELRDEAIACLALPDLKLQRRIEVSRGFFDRRLERYAVPATNSGAISIRRVSDDKEVLLLPNPAGTVESLSWFSHDGKYLPALCQDNLLRVWDLEHRAVVLTAPCGKRAATVDFEPEDRYVAVAVGAEVSIYELATGGKLNSFPTPFAPICVRYDPLGRMLAISSFTDNRVAIMDPRSGATLMTLTNDSNAADSNAAELAWHPRDPMLAVPAHYDGVIYLWDAATGRLLHTLKGHRTGTGNVEFSPDGELLISSGWDGMELWDVRAGEHLMAYGMLAGGGESFAPNGTGYGHSSYLSGTPELFSFASGRVARRWNAEEEDLGDKLVAYSWDGRWLAFGSGDFVKLFDGRTGDTLATLSTGPPQGLCFQKSGRGLLVSGERGLFLWPIRDADGAGELTIGPPKAVGSPGAWQQAGLSENGQTFAAFHGDHACIFDAEAMREVAGTAVCGHEKQLRFLSLSPDGLVLATGGFHDTVVRIWDAQTGARIKKLEDPEWLPEEGPVPAFEPSGRSLVVAVWESYRLWETNSWTPRVRISRPEVDKKVLAMSHRNGLIALRSGQTSIQLRDLATGEVLATLQSPIRWHVNVVAFSPDDTQLAVTHEGTRELLVWDLRLLREELARMGMDWNAPHYPPLTDEPTHKTVHFRVRTNSLPQALPTGESNARAQR